jgi:hypothetical protein
MLGVDSYAKGILRPPKSTLDGLLEYLYLSQDGFLKECK